MDSDKMKRGDDRAPHESGTPRWLLWLASVAFALWLLCGMLSFMHGGDGFKIVWYLFRFLLFGYVACYLFFISIRHICRNAIAGRPLCQVDGNDNGLFHLMHSLLFGLAGISYFLYGGYAVFAFFTNMFNASTYRNIMDALQFIMLCCWCLYGAYLLVVTPIFLLFRALSRPRKPENGLKHRNHAEAEARILKRQEASSVAEPADFNDLLALILVEIARTGGRFSRAEQDVIVILDFFKRKLGHDAARLSRDKVLIEHALDYPGDINRLLETLASRYPYPARLTAAYLIFLFAHTKNPPFAAELRLARNIAATLEIRPNDLRNIEAKYRDPTEAAAESARDIEVDSGFVLQKLGK